MGLFDKAINTMKTVSMSLEETFVNAQAESDAIYNDNREIEKLNNQIKVLDQELDAAYIQIGRRYLEYSIQNGQIPNFNINDVLTIMAPKLERKSALEKEVNEVEKRVKNSVILREKEQAEQEFLFEKSKLDKALAMDIISQEEYNMKLTAIRKKCDNFLEIRKVRQQFEVGIISYDEMQMKLASLM